IIVGLNANDVSVMLVHSSPQSMMCFVETVDQKNRFCCCFVYATNFRKDRNELWKCLERYKSIVSSNPWVLLGDWIVSLNVTDHSAVSSCKSNDMLDFQECIKDSEIKDLNYSGTYPNVHAVFLSHMTSDHSHGVLIMPQMLDKKKDFRFNNFIADKDEFISTVEHEWGIPIKGCEMFKLEEKVKVIQAKVDADPHNFVSHFQKFLGSSFPVKNIENRDLTVNTKISMEEAKFMVRKIKDDKIKAAMFDINDNKAPGPNGYTSKFFKKAWNVVGK
nr:RNA-directed DNA polymerase, eukaryota, reverse transcriptase zinc-binding domain protein [Tanacetum cinerariifolium]